MASDLRSQEIKNPIDVAEVSTQCPREGALADDETVPFPTTTAGRR